MVYMKSEVSIKTRIKSWFSTFVFVLRRLLVKICIVLIIGTVISFAIHYIKGFELGSVMRIVGIIIAIIGFASLLGGTSIRNDYNYAMAKISNPKIGAHDNSRQMYSDSLSFLIYMGTSGIILYLIGEAFI